MEYVSTVPVVLRGSRDKVWHKHNGRRVSSHTLLGRSSSTPPKTGHLRLHVDEYVWLNSVSDSRATHRFEVAYKRCLLDFTPHGKLGYVGRGERISTLSKK